MVAYNQWTGLLDWNTGMNYSIGIFLAGFHTFWVVQLILTDYKCPCADLQPIKNGEISSKPLCSKAFTYLSLPFSMKQ